jgi:TolB protein
VAFVSERGGRAFIYVAANRTGARPRQLTKDPRLSDADPTWSPDGRRIAFVRRDAFGVAFLYTMNADGSGLRFLLEAGDLCCPEWSPTGRRIAIALDSNIVVVDPRGKGRRLVTGADINSSPTWSPDGRWIAFSSDRSDEDDDEGDADIFVVAATGGPARQLTDNDDEDLWPDWSPDGRLIAFSRGDLFELESSIYVMGQDGKNERRLPLPAPAAMPSWQPLP